MEISIRDCQTDELRWVWMASSTTKRTTVSYGIMGNEAVASVAAGNCIAARVALLCMVAIVRGIFWCEFGLEVVFSCLAVCPLVC